MTMTVQGATELAAAFTRAEATALPAMAAVVDASATALRDGWRANARATAGHHGRRYPASITAERKIGFGSVIYEIGPERGKPQGGMGPGFEYGSRNQQPHLDGKRATDAEEPRFRSAIEAAAFGLL